MDQLACVTAFVRTVEAGSFAGAAGALGMSAAMIGRHIRALEDHLGAQLLMRTTRRHSLTEAGRLYYERSKIVLAELESADESVARMRAVPRGLLRVNAPVTFGAAALSPLVPEYLTANPEVRVELTLTNRVVDLVQEGYDAVIRTGELPDSGLIARALAPYRLVVCAAPSYLRSRGIPRTPADLETHACLGFRPGALDETWSFVDGMGAVVRVRVSGPLSINNGNALLAAALGGAGVIRQSSALLADEIAAGRLVRLVEGYEPKPLPMHILFSATRPPTPKLRSFLDFVSERLGAIA